MRRIAVLLALVAATLFAGQSQAVGMTDDEASLRAALTSCAILEEARERGISFTRLRVTVWSCSRATLKTWGT